MKKLYVIFILFLGIGGLKSQTWERSYTNTYTSVLSSKENEYNSTNGGIALGMSYTYPPITGLIRFNNLGDTLWTKKVKLDSINYLYYPEQTATLDNGNYLICGYAEGMPVSTYGRRFCTMELTSNGTCIKLNKYLTNQGGSASIIEESGNNHFVMYRNDSLLPPMGNNTQYRCIINKVSGTGSILWSKIYANIGTSANSTSQTIFIRRLKASKDKGCIYSKSMYSTSEHLEKLDSNGVTTWTVNLNTLLNVTLPFAANVDDIVCLKDSTYLVSCEIANSTSGWNIRSYLLKFNNSGGLMDSTRLDSTVLVSLMENSNRKIISNYISISNSTISSAGLMFFDKNLNYLNFYPTPFSMAPMTVGKISPNNMGGGLFSIGYTGFTYIVNFDSLLVTYPFKYSGNWSLDKNTNCALELTDAAHKNQILKIKETAAADSYCLTKNDGNYSVNLPNGTYTITHTPYKYRKYECPSNGGYTFTVTGAGSSNNNNLLDTLIPGVKDIGNVIFASGFAPGFTTNINVYYFNNGTTLVNSKIKILKDTSVIFVSSTPTLSSISGDTLIFNIPNFDYDSVGYINVTVSTKTFIPLGTKVTMISSFSLLNDTLPSNNIDTVSRFVTGSFDPNDKSVSEPYCMSVNNDLVYRVRFQNTGTGTAKNILIVDTLDTNLELTTFKLLYKSHPNLEIKWRSNNRMEYRFDNINLPDSNVNEPLSHGEFVYSIHTKSSLAVNTKIRNRAWIYFDYNAPIITNVVENKLCPLITSLNAVSIRNQEFDIYPNPTSEKIFIKFQGFIKTIEVYSMTGSLVKIKNINGYISNEEIDFGQLNEGLYIVKLSTKETSYSKKLVVIH